MAGERTDNPYRTFGPDGEQGESWADYFRRGKRVRSDTAEDERPEPLLVLGHGSWGPDDDHLRPRSLLGFDKLLRTNGFTVFEGVWRTTFEEGGVYGPTAQKAGEAKPDRLSTTIVYYGGKRGYGYCWVMFEQVNEGSWTCIGRSINGIPHPVSDAELKDWIKNA